MSQICILLGHCDQHDVLILSVVCIWLVKGVLGRGRGIFILRSKSRIRNYECVFCSPVVACGQEVFAGRLLSFCGAFHCMVLSLYSREQNISIYILTLVMKEFNFSCISYDIIVTTVWRKGWTKKFLFLHMYSGKDDDLFYAFSCGNYCDLCVCVCVCVCACVCMCICDRVCAWLMCVIHSWKKIHCFSAYVFDLGISKATA